MILNWPDGIYPKSQSFYIRHKSTRFISAFTGQYDVLERDAARWVAEFTFELDNASARKMDAFNRYESQIIWMRANNMPWKILVDEFDKSKTTLWRDVNGGLIRIAAVLNARDPEGIA